MGATNALESSHQYNESNYELAQIEKQQRLGANGAGIYKPKQAKAYTAAAKLEKTTKSVSHKRLVKTTTHGKQCYSLKAIEWRRRTGSAIDIAVGADDAIWTVSANGIPFRWNGKGWSQIGSKVATRIAVQPDGRPWIVTPAGELFRWHCVYWQKVTLPSGVKAQDCGAGANGDVWITGTNERIYKFNKSGKWDITSGGAVRIDVGPKGQIWVVNKQGRVYEKPGLHGAWKRHNSKPAQDVGVGAEGSVFITGEKPGIYKLGQNGKFWAMGGSARQVSVGKGGRPFVVNRHHHIYWPANTCVEEKSFEYYVDNKGKKTWFDAEETCKRWGGHLASIRQSREKARIMNLMALEGVNEKDAWVGGRHTKGWNWSDGYRKGSIRYWPMAQGQKAKGCTALNGRKASANAMMNGRMTSNECGKEKAFVCKRPVGGKAPGQIPGKQCKDFGRALPSRNTTNMHTVIQAKTANWLSKLDRISFCKSRSQGKEFMSKLRFMFNNFDNHVYNASIPNAKFFGCKTIKINKRSEGKVTYVKHFWTTLGNQKIATGFKIRFVGGQTILIGDRGCEGCHVYENFYKTPKTLIGFAAKDNGTAATSMRLIFNKCPARVFSHNTSGIRRGTQCKNEDQIAWKNRTAGQNASDITVDLKKNVYIAGEDGRVYKNESGRWSKPMNQSGQNAKRIAVTPKGEVFTVSSSGVVRSLGPKDSAWKSYSMRAVDVGAGANGQVWIVNGRGKVAFLKGGKFYVYGNTPCHANRVTVEYDGQPAIVCKNSRIFKSVKHEGHGQHWLKLAGRAMDIAAGPSGDLMIVGQNQAGHKNMGIWKFVERQRSHARGNYWYRLNGQGARGIAVGMNGHAYTVSAHGKSSWADKACESGNKRVWYFTSKFALNWWDAKAHCEKQGWHLAPVFTENENYQFQKDKDVQARSEVWIGGHNYSVQGRKYKLWRWSHNHRHFSFRNWAQNKPSRKGDCLALKKNGRWNNMDCKQERTFICRSNKVIDAIPAGTSHMKNKCQNYGKIHFKKRSGVKAVDIASNSRNQIFVAGKDGKVYKHGWRRHRGMNLNHWQQFGHNIQAVRVAAGADGMPWAVARNGKLYQFDSKKWRQVHADAFDHIVDIGINAKGNVWVAGRNGNIYHRVNNKWTRQGAPAAARITVSMSGQPVVCGKDGKVHVMHAMHGGRWNTLHGVSECADISVGMDGSMVAVTKNGGLYKARFGKMTQWVNMSTNRLGGTHNVAVGNNGRVMGINSKTNAIYWPRNACKYTKPHRHITCPWTFWLPKKSLDWHAARDNCRRAGGELASAANMDQYLLMNRAMKSIKGADAWVGHNDLQKDSKWVWSDKLFRNKTALLNRHWMRNMPNTIRHKDCGTANLDVKRNLKFGHSYCYNKKKFLCKAKKTSKPTTNPRPYCKNNFDYKFYAAKKTWTEARAACANDGGELASIQSWCEQHEISKTVGNAHLTWMGANAMNVKGEWNWSDNSQKNGLKWQHWATGQPQSVMGNQKEMCGVLVKSLAGHRWHDYPCNRKMPFVCKRAKDFKPKNAKFEFLLRRDKQSWGQARNVCRSWGGDLATINSWSEQRTAYRLVAENNVGRGASRVGRAWIGGKAVKNDWKWANGRKMGWNWFASSAKSEGCAEIYTPNARGKWNNRNCATPSAYICKRKVGAKARSSAWQSPKTFTSGEKQYAFQYFKRTWADARQFCLKWGGDLATINSAAENHYAQKVLKQVSKNRAAWIGANDLMKEGTFAWSSNKKFGFSNFRKGMKPSAGKDCVALQRSNGEWKDEECTRKHEFVCERKASEATFKYVSNAKLNWPDAQKACRTWGGHLASIRSASEQDQIKAIVHTKAPVWIGANDLLQEGKWMWTDGSLLTYKNWHKNEPNNYGGREDCGALWNGMKWNDWFCSSKAYYICEKRISTMRKERLQIAKEKEQRRRTALHFIAKRHAAYRREVLLKGKMTAEQQMAFEMRWTKRAHLQADVLLRQRIRDQKESKRQALLKIAAEKLALQAHAKRVRSEKRALAAKRREKISIKNAQIAAAAAAKAAARAVYERQRKVREMRRAKVARLARIAAQAAAKYARKMQGIAELKARRAINAQRRVNQKTKMYIRATTAAVVRAQNAIRARKIAERIYAAKVKVQRSMQRKAERHQRLALAGTIIAKKAYLKAKVATRNAMQFAALYKAQYYAALKNKRHQEKLTLRYNNLAAKFRHSTRVAYSAVRLANRRAAVAISKAKVLKVKYTALVALTKRAIKDTIHYRRLEHKAKVSLISHRARYVRANRRRLHLIKLTKRNHHAIKKVLKMIHAVKVKHAKMIRRAKAIIVKLVLRHKKMMAAISKYGKAAIHRIAMKLRAARKHHDKWVNWYKVEIAKMRKLHSKYTIVYNLSVKKSKAAIRITRHLNRLVVHARHAIRAAHKLTLRYIAIRVSHEKKTRHALHLYKRWSLKAKLAIKARVIANRNSVKAIARRVSAEATYNASHKKMLSAQRKSHVLRLQVVRYRKMVAHHVRMTKKYHSDTRFHRSKEAQWNRLAAIARSAARKYMRRAAQENKMRLHWIVVYKRRVIAERIALSKARRANAAAVAMEARARVLALAAKRATRLALRQNKLRLAAEKRTKKFIVRQIAAHLRYKKEEKLRYHYVRLGRQADRKASREWARRNRYVIEMKRAIKAMIISIRRRKALVHRAMKYVAKQNVLMINANKSAAKSLRGKIAANIKAGEFRKQRAMYIKHTAKFVRAAHKAHRDARAAKAKHAKFDRMRIIAIRTAKKYLAMARVEIKRRIFLEKVARSAKISAASFTAKMHAQKKFTAKAWKQYHHANKVAKIAIHARNVAIRVWKKAVHKYRVFKAKHNVHVRRTASIRLSIKHAIAKHHRQQRLYNKIHASWKAATTKAHKHRLAIRLAIHKRRVSHWLRMIAAMKRKLRLHLHALKRITVLFIRTRRAAKKMHSLRIKAEADARVAHKTLKVALHLKNVEVIKARKAHRNAVNAEKLMKKAVIRAAAALIRRKHAEHVSRKANLKMKHAIRWAHKMLHVRKVAVKLYLHLKKRATHATRQAKKMTIQAKMWVVRAKHMHAHSVKARRHADKIRHYLEKAQQRAKEAAAALKRSQYKLRIIISRRQREEQHLRVAVRARVHAHAVLRAAIAAQRRAYKLYIRMKRILFLAQASVRRAIVVRRIAEREAKKRLAFQQIRLHKWVQAHIAIRKMAMRASVRARIAAQVAHRQHVRAYRLRIHETRTQVQRTVRQTIMLAKMVARAKAAARRAERDARLRLRQRNVARRLRNRAIAAKLRAAAKAAREAAAQRAALLKAQAIRKAVHDYIMKVRLQHAVRNHKFDITQCKAAKKNLHALWGQHSLKSRKAAMRAARRNWCRAASTRMAQIKALHLVVKGKLTMRKVHALRKTAFNLERRARGQHNYVWTPRKSTCKDKCMKYKDWLKVVTALAKAMAMKPCGKVPGAPTKGVKYITHNKSVKIVHGNKMVLTHHITYHVCKAQNNCTQVRRTVTHSQKVAPRPAK